MLNLVFFSLLSAKEFNFEGIFQLINLVASFLTMGFLLVLIIFAIKIVNRPEIFLLPENWYLRNQFFFKN
jgi:hypothetical protein